MQHNLKLIINNFLKGDKKTKIIVAIGVIGMILILLSDICSNPKQNKKSIDSESISNEQYIENLETKLSNMISKIDGVGKSEIMITLQSGNQYKYARENKTQTDKMEDIKGEEDKRLQLKDNKESNYILIEDENGNKKALVETQIEPQIKGAVVICQGAGSEVVKQRITEVLTTILGIGANRVCVTPIE